MNEYELLILMKKHGYTVKSLSEKLRVSPPTISNLLNKKVSASLKLALKLKELFGKDISFEDLLMKKDKDHVELFRQSQLKTVTDRK